MFENRELPLRDEFIRVLAESDNDIAFSLYTRFYSTEENAFIGIDGLKQAMFGLDTFVSETNRMASNAINNRLISKQRNNILKEGTNDDVFIANTLRTNSELRLRLQSSFNSVFNVDGLIPDSIQDKFDYSTVDIDDKEYLKLNYNNIIVTIDLDDISNINTSENKMAFQLPNVEIDLDLEDIEAVTNVISLMRDLGFDHQIATQSFLNNTPEAELKSIIGSVMYGVYANIRLKTTKGDVQDSSIINTDKISNYDNDAGNVAYINIASLTNHYSSYMVNHLANVAGVDGETQIALDNGTKVAGTTLRKSLSVRYDSGADFFEGNIYNNGQYSYLGYNGIPGFKKGDDYFDFDKMSDRGILNTLMEKLFLGSIRKTGNTYFMKTYTSERSTREAHQISSSDAPIRVNDNLNVDDNYYIKKIADVRKQNINNTAKLLHSKYSDVFNLDKETSVRAFNMIDLDESLLIGLNEDINSIDASNMVAMDSFIKSFPSRLNISEKETVKLLTQLELSPGVHFSKDKLGLRDSMVFEFNIYNNKHDAKKMVKYELSARMKFIERSGYTINRVAKENLENILEVKSLTDKRANDILSKTYSYNNMIHSSAINHIAFGSMFQFKEDISDTEVEKIRQKEIALKNAYNAAHPKGKQRTDTDVDNMVESQKYLASINKSVSDFYKRTATATSAHMSPVLIGEDEDGPELREFGYIAHLDDLMKSNTMFGSMANDKKEVSDAQSFVHPITRARYAASDAGQFSKYAQGNIPVKSSDYGMDASNGGFYIQKESQANLYGKQGLKYTEYGLLLKMNTAINYSKDGEPIVITVPEVEVIEMYDDEEITTLSYALTGGTENIEVKNLQDIYEYYGGFDSDIDGLSGTVASALDMNPHIANEFIDVVANTSGVKSLQRSVNDSDALRSDTSNMIYFKKSLKDFGIILSKDKHAFEKNITIATQIINLGAGSSIHEGTNIGDAFAAISHISAKELSDDLKLVLAKMIDSNTEFSSEAKALLNTLSSNGIPAFEYLEQLLEKDDKSLPFVKDLYNRYLTQLTRDNIDESRNSEDVIEKLNGNVSNFNLAQIKSLSESLLRSSFYDATLNYKTSGIESIMVSVYDQVKLHKLGGGRYGFKSDAVRYEQEFSTDNGDFPTFGEKFLVEDEDNDKSYILNYTEYESLKEDGTLGENLFLFKKRKPVKTSLRGVTATQLKQYPNWTNAVGKEDGSVAIVVNDVFTEDDFRNEDMIIYQRSDINAANYVSMPFGEKKLPKGRDYFIAYNREGKKEMVIPVHRKLYERTYPKAVFDEYIPEIISERNLNYYKFTDNQGVDVEETSQWKSLNYYENNGEFKSFYSRIPEQVFKVFMYNFEMPLMSSFKEAGLSQDDIYDIYLKMEGDQRIAIENEFRGQFKKIGKVKAAKLKIFFRALLMGEIKNGKYNISQPEVIMAAPFHKSFGIPVGTQLYDIYGDSDNKTDMLANAEEFFEGVVTVNDLENKYKYVSKFNKNNTSKAILKIQELVRVNPDDEVLKEVLKIYEDAVIHIEFMMERGDSLYDIDTQLFEDKLFKIQEKLLTNIAHNRAVNLDEALNVIVTRIPLQSKQSTSYSRIMEFNWDMGNSIFVSDGHYKVMGADNDADTTNVMTYVYRKNGTRYEYKNYLSPTGRIDGFDSDSLLIKIKVDPGNQANIIKDHIENLAFNSKVLDQRLLDIEARIRESFSGTTHSEEALIKAINNAKRVEYTNFTQGMQNYIVDNMKAIYTDINNIFEIQSIMSSDILTDILKDKEGIEGNLNLEDDFVNHDYDAAFVQEIVETAINEGGAALGKVINIEAYVAMINRSIGGRTLKTKLDMSFYNDSEVVDMESEGLFDDSLHSNSFDGGFKLNYEFNTDLVDANAKSKNEKECA